MISRLRAEGPALAVLGPILLAGLVLRVVHNDHGLPYVYYVDEGSHFTKRAVEVFRDPNPGYFQNPSAYTYLLHLVYRAVSLPFGGGEKVIGGYRNNADWVYEISRGFAAVLCLVGVVAVYVAGRQLWNRRTGLVAAAILCFAFLPVAFSRIAVTDVGTLAPVALGLLFSVLLLETRALRWAAAAGVAAGLAIAFKYTAGLILLAPALALALPLWRVRTLHSLHAAALGALAVGAGTVVAFLVFNPFFLLDLRTALHQLRGQAELAGSQDKFGQEQDNGVLYYLDSLTWGLGWVAALAALAGAVLLWRRDRARLALLLVFPVALFVYLSLQSRFFGRWLLPAYPALALLAGYAAVRAIELVRVRARRLEWPAVAAVGLLLLWQPLAADARSMAVLGKRDTRAIARLWLVENAPRELRIIIEPAVPQRYYWPVIDGRPQKRDRPQFVEDFIRDIRATHIEYGHTLNPGVLERYRRRGYCMVMTMGLIRGRAQTAEDADALAYYERLERESDRVFTVSPFRADEEPAAFSFDLSYSYYSPAYERPGPEIHVYRLHDCDQRFGGARHVTTVELERPAPPTPALSRGVALGVLAVILLVALALRLWNLDHGLPFAYNADEDEHFVPRALNMLGGSLDPGYYENPPALTYLLYAVYAVGGLRDPGEDAFLTARVVVALIGTLVVGLAYWAGARFYERRVGLVAAALMAVAFLPVFYSKQALNDVVTLAPISVALVGSLLAFERGRWHDWALAGGAVGVAAATKYTAGAMLLCVLVAAALRVHRDRTGSSPSAARSTGTELRRAVAGLAIAGAAFVALFLLVNPYALIELDETRRQIEGQSDQADSGKLGQDDMRGWVYYVGTLGWGLGWLPLAAAVGGAVMALRRDWRRAALLIAFPLFLYLFLGAQGRFFGRWMLPAYPMLCVLCGYGVVALADAVTRRRPRYAAAAVAGLAAVVCAQGAIASVRVDALLGREDTRAQALRWIGDNVPPGAPMVVEPFVPESWKRALDRPLWPVERPYQAYEKRLRVRHIERYRERGHCWVVVGSTQKQRGLKAGLRSSRNYYRALDAESERTVTFSPYEDGADPVEFSYDFSFNYHPRAYERPGPVVEIHELSGCP